MSDPVVRHLARELSAMRDRIRAMEVASQAAFRSIEGGSIDVYDDETDELLGVIGVQKDGSVGVDIKSGRKPETPTEPDVQPIPGGAIVAWDGRFEDRQSALVIDRIAVHMDETPGFTPDRDTEVAAIRSTGSGGTAVIPLDDGAEWYVKLVAVSKGGVWSDPSTEVFVAAVDAEVAFYQDEFTLTADGAQDLQLTFEPISFSEHLYWNGLYQREDVSWTRLGNTVTLIGDEAEAGDTITVEYAYLDEVGAVTLVPWQATGWKRLQVATTDNTDRSATGFDDSAWTVDKAAFGNNTSAAHPYSYPAASTTWAKGTRMWMRRQIGDIPTDAETVTVSVRVDDTADVYWNGTLLGSCTSVGGGQTLFTFNAPSWSVTNVLAVRGTDAASNPSDPANWCYLDASVTAGRN